MIKNKIEEEKIRCKNCGSLQTYVKISSHERICRRCGYVEDLNNVKGDKK